MLGQSTLREGIELARDWGPVGVSLVGILVYGLWSKVSLRKKAFDPVLTNSKKIGILFDKCDSLFERDVDLDKQIDKKISYPDVDTRLVQYQLKEVCDAQFKAVEARLAHMENMLSEIHLMLLKKA